MLSWMWCTKLLVVLYWQNSLSECLCIVGFVTVNHFNFGSHTMYKSRQMSHTLLKQLSGNNWSSKFKIWLPVNPCSSIQFSEILDTLLTCLSVLYQSVPSAIIPLGKLPNPPSPPRQILWSNRKGLDFPGSLILINFTLFHHFKTSII